MNKSFHAKIFSLFIIVLLMFSFAETAFSRELKDNSLIKVAGIIADISPDTGKVSIADTTGMALSLTASMDVELRNFKAGDNVVVEYDRLSGIILSMIKHDLK
ncbi:hypothetical protein [Desulfobacterium sp. N47]|uniref:DUF5666 domain-containing protein n=1 Tax=uncultured Desulfobacterium sp. TaxID=201089 RepID=E1YCD6_9BACT|nr:unknown protein [uncultured Desulfobacterium sp.]